MTGGFRHLGDRELLAEHYVIRYVLAEFEAPDGSTFERGIVRSPGAVAVVPVLAGDEPVVRLVRQYRPTYDRWETEIPAGTRDIPGEQPLDTGRRELVEEAGLEAAEIVHLTDLLPSPGMTDSVLTLLLATGCRPVPDRRQGVEEEYMELLDVPLAEAVAMVERGEIGDAKSVAGLLLAGRRLLSS